MTHTIRRTTLATLTATTLLAGVLASCSDNTDNPTVSLTSTNENAFPGPQDTRKSADDQAKDAAIAKANEFYAVQGELDSTPAVPIEKLGQVADGPVLAGYTADITLRRSQGVVSTGAVKIVSAKVTDFGVPKDDKGNPASGPAWVHVVTCNDISGWDSKHADGASAVDPNRGHYVSAKITVRDADWPSPNGWKVTSEATEKVTTCGT